ncbi:unnamed protein product [Rotaria socialis]|uniref:Tyrosine-protein kinase n=1 Tax=Rotaria socialis TaxID=392032 RepID=A0A818VI17_9BILA|nr:unnamed protein product [Rotaria socialis]CAF4499498.1 unnamed protein product [Rotaria socialis]
MSNLKTTLTLSRQCLTPSVPRNNAPSQPSAGSSVDEVWRLRYEISCDHGKLLQYIKEMLEETITLDKQYAENLQRLMAETDCIKPYAKANPMNDVCQNIFLQWSKRPTSMLLNVEKLQNNVFDGLLKNLLEKTNDLKAFLENEKHQYEAEMQTAEENVKEAEERYANEAKVFCAKNAELMKVKAAAKIDDNKRIAMERFVMEKRDYLYRAHNEYILAIREYDFHGKQQMCKIISLAIYFEKAQSILNQDWKCLLEAIADYGFKKSHLENSNRYVNMTLHLSSKKPYQPNDGLVNIDSNVPWSQKSTIKFNDSVGIKAGLPNLKDNEILTDESAASQLTNVALKNKIQTLISDLKDDINKLENLRRDIEQTKNNDISYYVNKSLFQKSQQVESLRQQIEWKQNIKNDLQEALDDAGFNDTDTSDTEIPTGLSDKLEDLPYFHGIIPRTHTVSLLNNKGDYLLRRNDRGKIVLSILWTDPDDHNKLKDGHYFIHEINNNDTNETMYSFHDYRLSKPTVPKLISFYVRQKLELRDDGTRLIRAVEKPNYIINHHDVKVDYAERLGKGNFGEVFRGEYRNHKYAIKILRSKKADENSRDRDRFVNEALILKRYTHPRIVKFIGIVASCEPLMIVMELAKRGSLSSYVKANDFNVSQLTKMCRDIAKGMAYLESNHVIHRDLAARNCLVDKDGRVKVGDFGLSRCLYDDEVYFNQITEFPVRWWASEVLQRKPYTTKSDVWSYGITIWEVFSKAEVPYNDISANYLVMDAVKAGKRLEKPGKCPTNIYEIMYKCWLENPKERYDFATIVELLKKEKTILSKLPFFGSSK